MKYSIVTKTGDSGETSLLGGIRVPKNHIRVIAYGEIDELNAALGVCLSFAKQESLTNSTLEQVQYHLFEIGSELANSNTDKSTKEIFFQKSTEFLEKTIIKLELKLPQLKNFILPGGSKTASFLHSARTICRRSERSIVSLMKQKSISPDILVYINRLSDLLFLLARDENISNNIEEKIWIADSDEV